MKYFIQIFSKFSCNKIERSCQHFIIQEYLILFHVIFFLKKKHIILEINLKILLIF